MSWLAVGVIPARGGSKGILGKNLYPLRGRPLIEYTFDAAKASRSLCRVVLTTDDRKIAGLGRTHGIEVPFLRPKRLARDHTTMVDVLLHVLRALRSEGTEPDCLVLLQPTSPLRHAKHIDAAVELLKATKADTVVSVVKVPHQYSPMSLMRLERDGRLVPYSSDPQVFRRQDKPLFYARNGPAVLAVRTEVLDAGKLYGSSVYPLEMSQEESIDIDEAYDLFLAECLLEQRERSRKTRNFD